MTTRKTLALNPEAATAEAPALKKKGRGWKISDKRLVLVARDHREYAIPTTPQSRSLS
jgi:hypothetical protein